MQRVHYDDQDIPRWSKTRCLPGVGSQSHHQRLPLRCLQYCKVRSYGFLVFATEMSVDSMEIYAIEIYRVYQGPFLAMLLAFQGSSTCHVPGQRCLAGCSKSNRLKRIWSKIIKSVFFYFVKISLTKIVRNLGPIQYIDTEWALRTTFWHSDSPDIWSPKALRHSVCCAGRKENLPYLVAEIFRHASFGHPDAQRARDAVAFVIICRI